MPAVVPAHFEPLFGEACSHPRHRSRPWHIADPTTRQRHVQRRTTSHAAIRPRRPRRTATWPPLVGPPTNRAAGATGDATATAVSLRTTSSLTGSSATGLQSRWHVNGARHQYVEAFTTWNRDDDFPASLPFDPRTGARPFPVPALLVGGSADTAVDVVVTADFTAGSSSARAALDDALTAKRDGRSVALFHQPNTLEALQRDLDERVVDALRSGELRLLSAGETAHCSEIRRHGGGVPGGVLDGGPDVVADRLVG